MVQTVNMKTYLDLLSDLFPNPKSDYGCYRHHTVIESFTEMEQPIWTRKSLSISKTGRHAPSAGTLAKEAVRKTVYYCV